MLHALLVNQRGALDEVEFQRDHTSHVFLLSMMRRGALRTNNFPMSRFLCCRSASKTRERLNCIYRFSKTTVTPLNVIAGSGAVPVPATPCDRSTAHGARREDHRGRDQGTLGVYRFTVGLSID